MPLLIIRRSIGVAGSRLVATRPAAVRAGRPKSASCGTVVTVPGAQVHAARAKRRSECCCGAWLSGELVLSLVVSLGVLNTKLVWWSRAPLLALRAGKNRATRETNTKS